MPKENRYGAFLLYVDDWLSSTAIELMTAAEERGYLRLLLHAWKSDDCGLPDDDAILAQLSKLGRAWSRNSKSGAVLREQFVAKNGRLYNERLSREREHQQQVRTSRADAAAVAANARWDASRIRRGCVGNANPNPNYKEQALRGDFEKETHTLSPLWDEFRRVYPASRFDEDSARGAWKSKDDDVRILEGLKAHLPTEEWKRDLGRFVPKASKFIADGLYKAVPRVVPSITSTMHPETARRIRESRYFDPTTITGPQETKQ